MLEVHPTAAEVVGEDKLLPGLVVLYSVFGLGEKSREIVKWEIVCEKVSQSGAQHLEQCKFIFLENQGRHLFLDPGLDRGLISQNYFHLKKREASASQTESMQNFILLTQKNLAVNSMKVMYLYKEKHANSNSGAQCQA